MTVSFKPLAGLFSQFKYLPLKYMGNLTIELELVTSATDCIIDYRDDTADTAVGNRFANNANPGDAGQENARYRNTSIQWEINNTRLACDVCTLGMVIT